MFQRILNVVRKGDGFVNMIGLGDVVQNVYEGVEPISMQKKENAVHMLNADKVVGINEMMREMVVCVCVCDGSIMKDILQGV